MSARIVTKTKTDSQARARRAVAGRNFWRNEDGSLIIFSLFLLIMMLMIAGMSVDLMRSETHRARLQATLDRAVLAGASLEQTLNSEDVVQDYFDKAGLGQFVTGINVVETPTSKMVNASAEMAVNSYFMNMLGVYSLHAPAGGQAEESLTDVEISLVVDVSGSMAQNAASGGTKINVLKAAAKEFVYLMQCDPDAEQPFDNNCVVEDDTVSISLIPYNQQVMLGEDIIEQFNITQEHNNSSCVDMDAADYNVIPVELDPQVADPLALPDPTPNVKRSTQLDFWTGYGGNSQKGARDLARECQPNTGTHPWNGQPYSDRAVHIYENDYQDLEDAIDDLYSSGNTSIDLAMKWGAAFLAPEFAPAVTNLANNYGVIPTEFIGRPFSYTRPRSKKVVVLMTDGKNTSKIWVENQYRDGMSPFFAVRDDHSAIPGNNWNAETDHLTVYSQARDDAGWRPYRHIEHNNWEWTPDGGANAQQLTWPEVWERYQVITVANAMDEAGYSDDRWWEFVDYDYTSIKDTRLNSICTAAKDAGILIFTIGFETSVASNQVLENCASSPSHHYDVQGLDLTEAFNSIAREIHELRLTN